jgi:hypothetical protein
MPSEFPLLWSMLGVSAACRTLWPPNDHLIAVDCIGLPWSFLSASFVLAVVPANRHPPGRHADAAILFPLLPAENFRQVVVVGIKIEVWRSVTLLGVPQSEHHPRCLPVNFSWNYRHPLGRGVLRPSMSKA